MAEKDKGQSTEVEMEVDLMRPEEAVQVAELFRAVYGDGYPVQTYYQADELAAANAQGRVISSVARTPDGRVVGHNALYHSAAGALICESGAGLVHPEFRSGSLFNRMVEHGVEVGAPRHGVQAVFCEPVCNHVFSQKLCNTQGYLTCAMELSLMPSAAYVKEKSAKGRVSTTLVFKVLQSLAHQVYLPGDYAETLRELYEGLNDEREFTASQPGEPNEDGTRLEVNYFEFARVARLALWRAGSDLAAVLDRELGSLHDKGVEVVQMWINLTNPHTDFIIKELKNRGYFLGGLLPRWFDVDGMLMQWLAAPPDWENMNLLFPRDMKVRDMVRADWERSS